MKKSWITSLCVCALAVGMNAQTPEKQNTEKKDNKTQEAAVKQDTTKKEEPKGTGTRMAITQKGVPSSKPKSNAATSPNNNSSGTKKQ